MNQPVQCPYCKEPFVPMYKNRYGWQKVCSKSACRAKQNRDASKRGIEKNHQHYKDAWNRRNRLVRPPLKKPNKSGFLRCYMCDYAIRLSDKLCGRCGWLVNEKKAVKAQEKYQ